MIDAKIRSGEQRQLECKRKGGRKVAETGGTEGRKEIRGGDKKTHIKSVENTNGKGGHKSQRKQ